MRKLRVTATMKKQFDSMRDRNGKPRGGVFLIPRVKPLDEWEAIAVAAQQALIERVRH